jgi:hypothetical protein
LYTNQKAWMMMLNHVNELSYIKHPESEHTYMPQAHWLAETNWQGRTHTTWTCLSVFFSSPHFASPSAFCSQCCGSGNVYSASIWLNIN